MRPTPSWVTPGRWRGSWAPPLPGMGARSRSSDWPMEARARRIPTSWRASWPQSSASRRRDRRRWLPAIRPGWVSSRPASPPSATRGVWHLARAARWSGVLEPSPTSLSRLPCWVPRPASPWSAPRHSSRRTGHQRRRPWPRSRLRSRGAPWSPVGRWPRARPTHPARPPSLRHPRDRASPRPPMPADSRPRRMTAAGVGRTIPRWVPVRPRRPRPRGRPTAATRPSQHRRRRRPARPGPPARTAAAGVGVAADLPRPRRRALGQRPSGLQAAGGAGPARTHARPRSSPRGPV